MTMNFKVSFQPLALLMLSWPSPTLLMLDIVSSPAFQVVVPGPAIQKVIADSAFEGIVAVPAFKIIMACSTLRMSSPSPAVRLSLPAVTESVRMVKSLALSLHPMKFKSNNFSEERFKDEIGLELSMTESRATKREKAEVAFPVPWRESKNYYRPHGGHLPNAMTKHLKLEPRCRFVLCRNPLLMA